MNLHIIIHIISLTVSLVSFFIAISVFGVSGKKGILQYFFIYALINVLLVGFYLFSLLTNSGFKDAIFNINFISNIYLFVYLGLLIKNEIKGLTKLIIANIIFYVFYLLTILAIIIKLNSASDFSILILPHFGLLIMAILYFLGLYQHVPSTPLQFVPEVWAIIGICFQATVTILSYVFIGFFIEIGSKIYISIVGFGIVIGYIMFSLFFIKGLLCFTNREKLLL